MRFIKTNEQVATALGVSKSTASRMRSGQRIGSPAVLMRVAEVTQNSLDTVMGAAAAARAGDTRPWTEMLEGAFGPAGGEREEEPELDDVAV